MNASQTAPEAIVLHALPGRVRLRFPDRRDDAGWLAAVTERLLAYPQVAVATPSPATGGLLVLYDGTLADLAAQARRDGLFALERLEPAAPDAASELKHKMTAFGRWVDLTTGEGGAVPALVFLLLVVGGLVQVARGNVLAPAVTLFWYAATLGLAARLAGRPK